MYQSAVENVLKMSIFAMRRHRYSPQLWIFLVSLFGRKNIQILNCQGIFGHLSDIFRPWKATIPWAIKYLNIFRNKKWCIQKTCTTVGRLTFRTLICNPMNTGGVASQKSSFFSTISTALRWIFVVSKIGEWEEILHILTHCFPTHRLLVGSMVKYLVAHEVLMGCFDFCQEKPPNRHRGQH